MPPPPLTSGSCANCHNAFGRNKTGTTTTTSDCLLQNNHETVPLLQALSTVYGYPLHNSSVRTDPWNENDQFAFCETCANLISLFYKTYLELRELADAKSCIFKVINQIQNRFNSEFTADQLSKNENGDQPNTRVKKSTISEDKNVTVKEEPEDATLNEDLADFDDYVEPTGNDVSEDDSEDHFALEKVRRVARKSTTLSKKRKFKKPDSSSDADYTSESSDDEEEQVPTKKKIKETFSQHNVLGCGKSTEVYEEPSKFQSGGCRLCKAKDCLCKCWCTVCKENFTSTTALNRHINTDHNEPEPNKSNKRTFTCPLCKFVDLKRGSIFSSSVDLKTHCYNDHDETVNFCLDCGKAFSSEKYLRSHKDRVHKNTEHQEDYDNDEPENEGATEPGEILLENDSQKVYKCVSCDNTEFKMKHQLTKHLIFHNSNQTKPKFGCAFCTNFYYREDTLKRHLSVHSGKSRKSCSQCGKVFARQYHLNRHLANLHSKVPKTRKQTKEAAIDYTGQESLPQVVAEPDENETKPDIHNVAVTTAVKPKISKKMLKKRMKTVEDDTQESVCRCTSCNRQFGSSYKLLRHIKTEHPDDDDTSRDRKRLTCPLCFAVDSKTESIFSGYTNLKAHCAKDHEEVINLCTTCGKLFTTHEYLMAHRGKVHEAVENDPAIIESTPNQLDLEPGETIGLGDPLLVSYSCDDCNVQFAQRHLMTRHVLVHNEVKPKFGCALCPKTFFREDTLRRHVGLHTGKRIKTCPVCGKRFPRQYALDRHLKSKHVPNLSKLQETALEKISNRKPKKWTYKRREVSLRGPVACSKCSKTFSRQTSLTLHMRFGHPDDKPILCPICGEAFKNPNQFRKHKLTYHRHETMHEDKPLVFVCALKDCGKSFTTRNSLRRHEQVHKPQGQHVKVELTCLECHQTFDSRGRLRRHMMEIHSDEEYLCALCGKAFKDPRGLSQHQVMHNPERPFCCSICGMTFKRANHLKDHEKTHDPNSPRPFVCLVENCGKSFRTGAYLKKHEQLHSGTKDFTCEICGRAFGRVYNLRAHVKNVHKKLDIV